MWQYYISDFDFAWFQTSESTGWKNNGPIAGLRIGRHFPTELCSYTFCIVYISVSLASGCLPSRLLHFLLCYHCQLSVSLWCGNARDRNKMESHSIVLLVVKNFGIKRTRISVIAK